MIRFIALLIGLMLLFSIAASGQLRLEPLKYSKVKLVNGKHSKVVDLDEVLIGSNGSLAGEAPHKYRVCFGRRMKATSTLSLMYAAARQSQIR